MRLCTTCGSRFSSDARYCPVDGQPTVEQAEPAVKQDPLVGQLIDGRYLVERPIGEGGMGVVYVAMHQALQKRFALKVLRGEMARDADVLKRFMQEAQSSTAIGHPNIVDISDFGKLPDGSSYFVMEYLDGLPLTQAIARSKGLSVEVTADILAQIASALAAAHERGIVHRDLKPDNIFLIRRGATEHFVKVLDFGIAKVGGAASKLTRTGMVFGTPHYMSPEQAAGQAVDRRTDIYALGVIVYEMLTGKVPFDADTFMGILSKHMFEAPRPPAELSAKSGGPLDPLVMKMLVKKPEHRYQSMEEVLADLATLRAGGRIKPPVASVPPPSNVLAAFERVTGGSQEGPDPSRLVLLAGIALLVVGVFVGGAAFVFTRRTTQVATPLPIVFPMPRLSAGQSAGRRTATIRIESDPMGAVVYAGEAIVGETPVEVPRPSEGSTTLEIRLDGYRSEPLVVHDVSESPVFVPLNRIGAPPRPAPSPHTPATPRAGGTARSPSTTSPPSTSMLPDMPAPQAMQAPAPRIASDVVDPWQ